MYEVIGNKGEKVTDTIHLTKEFRLFHRYIAHNIIPKAENYNQVTNIDAFIIYKAAMEEPLNLNYTILKEMADVRNHSLSKGFSMNTIKKGVSFSSSEEERDEVERDEGIGHQHMEVEDLEIPPHVDPNFEIPQLPWRDDNTVHEEEPIHEATPMEEEVLMHRAYPTQEGTSSQEGYRPGLGDLFYEQGKQHEKHGEYIDRLWDYYAKLYKQQADFDQKYTNRMACMEAQLEGIWMHVDPPPPSPPFDHSNVPPPSCPYYRRPPY
ncbi:hypothetical protein Acr_08g0015670 [Actinidia rufa]|uniref:Uncharacterized protein n=1 Tax=Actinidia rufa TaxID=165716 RepID=A0A7J0F3A1_9ERIC|nr:hypothetical protein Acr_08g0015670 [Actinidia rufa]